MRFIASLLIVIVFFGCEEAGTIGEGFIGDEIIDVSLLDTISVELSTFIYDPFQTSNGERLLVGHHMDDSLGSIMSKSYFSLDFSTLGGIPGDNASFSSAVFQLFYDGYSYYDTIPPFDLGIYYLSEKLKLDEDDDNLLNTDSFDYSLDSIFTEGSFIARPNIEMVEVEVTDVDLMKSIFELAKFDLDSLEDFFNLTFNGMVLSAEKSSGDACFLGFTTENKLVIKYRESQEDRELSIGIGASTHFNEIDSDRTSTSLSSLTDQDNPLASSVSGNTVYFQNGIGLGVMMDIKQIPLLKEVFTAEELYRAELELIPVNGSYDPETPITPTFGFELLDEADRPVGSFAFPINISIDHQYHPNTLITLDITDYIKFELNKESNIDYKIRMTQGGVENSIDRIWIDDSRLNTALKIYTFIY